MQEVIAVVQAVRRRAYFNLVIEHLFKAAFFVVVVLAAATLLAKIVFFPHGMDMIAYTALTGVGVIAAYALVFARVRYLSAAISADEKLGLAERLSTALVFAENPSPFARVVVEDARDKARRVNVAGRFPIVLPARWRSLALALVVLAGIFCLPQGDLFGRKAAIIRREKERKEGAKVAETTRQRVAEIRKVVPLTDLETLEILDGIDLKLADIQENELSKEKALAALSGPMEKLAERMKEIAREFAKGAQSTQMELAKMQMDRMLADAKSMLGKLNEALKAAQLTEEQRAQLAKALERAAKKQEMLSAAKAQLDKLSEALEKGDKLTPEQAEQLAKALQELAKSMSQEPGSDEAQLSQQLSQLAQAMQSGDSQNAQQQLQQAQAAFNTSMQGLSTQMAALFKSAGQAGLGQETFADMTGSQSMGDNAADLLAMAGAMKGLNDMKAGLFGSDSLSLAEALEQLEAAALMAGQGSGTGLGMMGAGTGAGNVWETSEDTGDPLQKDKISGQMKPGRVVASYLVPGGNIKNEARAEFQEVLLESKTVAKEALTDQKVPRAYEKVVGAYFESLEMPK